MTTKVVNLRLGQVPGAILVARPSPYGNPWGVTRGRYTAARYEVATLSEALSNYEEWLFSPQLAMLLAQAKMELRNKTLACWCVVDLTGKELIKCHAQILARAVDGRKRPIFGGKP